MLCWFSQEYIAFTYVLFVWLACLFPRLVRTMADDNWSQLKSHISYRGWMIPLSHVGWHRFCRFRNPCGVFTLQAWQIGSVSLRYTELLQNCVTEFYWRASDGVNIINVGYSENNLVYLTCDGSDAVTVLSNDGEMCLPVFLLVLLKAVGPFICVHLQSSW